MPIRLCQKCGLKVLIDESQAGANPFYCQRCTTAMKSSGEPAEVAVSGLTPSRREIPSSAPSPTPQPAAPARATVKVLCPYCKASFNGRVPQKPARGACPVCQKELILLPTGDIRPSSGFDISRWQEEQKGEPAGSPEPVAAAAPPTAKESGTRLLVKKYAAEPPPPTPAPAAKQETRTRVLSPQEAEPPPAEATAEGGALPDWLNDNVKSRESATEDLEKEKEYQRDPAATEAEPELPAESADEPAAEPSSYAEPSEDRPPEEPAPQEIDFAPPPPAPPPPPAAAGPGLRRPGTVRRLTERKPLSAPQPAAAAPTGGGKVVLAWLMLLIPLIACPVLFSSRAKFKGTLVEKVGGMFQKGFLALHKKLFPPPPPPPPPPEKKEPEPPPPPPPPPKPVVDPDQQKKDEQKISSIWNEVLAKRRNLKQIGVAATPEQKVELEKIRVDIQKKEDQVKELRAQYRTAYGKDYDPDNP